MYYYMLIPANELTQEMINCSTSTSKNVAATITRNYWYFFTEKLVVLEVSEEWVKQRDYFDKYRWYTKDEIGKEIANASKSPN